MHSIQNKKKTKKKQKKKTVNVCPSLLAKEKSFGCWGGGGGGGGRGELKQMLLTML